MSNEISFNAYSANPSTFFLFIFWAPNPSSDNIGWVSAGLVLGWALGDVLGCGVFGVSAAKISVWGITTPAAVKNDAIAALVNNFFFIYFSPFLK